jgi:hypothetical protein
MESLAEQIGGKFAAEARRFTGLEKIAPSCDFKTAVSFTQPAGRSLNRTYLLGPTAASVITYGPRSTRSRGSRGEAASRNCTASLRA